VQEYAQKTVTSGNISIISAWLNSEGNKKLFVHFTIYYVNLQLNKHRLNFTGVKIKKTNSTEHGLPLPIYNCLAAKKYFVFVELEYL
jgi:hypothetical protein